MTLVLLSAGNATRLGNRAPQGCKALSRVGGRTMLSWWQAVDKRPLVVCRTNHSKGWQFPSETVDTIACDEGGGPAVALRAALPHVRGPVTVAYADTWVPAASIPDTTDWCGVGVGHGGRSWDVLDDGLLKYRPVKPRQMAVVAIGLYRFANVVRLAEAVDESIAEADGECGMAPVVNRYRCRFLPVVGWQDVGDVNALDQWKALA